MCTKRLIFVQQKPDDSSPHLRCSCEAYEWQTLPCCTILRQRSHQSQTGDRPPPSSHNEQQTFTEQSHNCWSYVLIFHKRTKPHQLSTVWTPKVNCCIVNGAKVLYDRMSFLMFIMISLCCCRSNHAASHPLCCIQSWCSSVINFQGQLSGVSESQLINLYKGRQNRIQQKNDIGHRKLPRLDDCFWERQVQEHAWSPTSQTASKCHTPGNSDPHTNTRSTTRNLRSATDESTIPGTQSARWQWRLQCTMTIAHSEKKR